MKTQQRIALITGASSGLGKEFARLFARGGYSVVLVARNEEKLERIKKNLAERYGVPVRVLVQDLSEHDAAEKIFKKVPRVDALVNNAGFGSFGPFWELPLKNELSMLDVNVRVLTELTGLYVPGMVERKKGQVLNIASTAAFQAGPTMATYFASKAYVLSFSEALYLELKDKGVHVTCLCPGPTRTGFEDRSGNHNLFKKQSVMEPEEVALLGYESLRKKVPVVIAGKRNRMLVRWGRHLPRLILAKMAGRMMK